MTDEEFVEKARELVACRNAFTNCCAEAEMWEAWAGSLRDSLDALVRASRGHLGDDHPLITRALEVMRNG